VLAYRNVEADTCRQFQEKQDVIMYGLSDGHVRAFITEVLAASELILYYACKH
jgi:hypothetical protein